jgi:hypothetical protein
LAESPAPPPPDEEDGDSSERSISTNSTLADSAREVRKRRAEEGPAAARGRVRVRAARRRAMVCESVAGEGISMNGRVERERDEAHQGDGDRGTRNYAATDDVYPSHWRRFAGWGQCVSETYGVIGSRSPGPSLLFLFPPSLRRLPSPDRPPSAIATGASPSRSRHPFTGARPLPPLLLQAAGILFAFVLAGLRLSGDPSGLVLISSSLPGEDALAFVWTNCSFCSAQIHVLLLAAIKSNIL